MFDTINSGRYSQEGPKSRSPTPTKSNVLSSPITAPKIREDVQVVDTSILGDITEDETEASVCDNSPHHGDYSDADKKSDGKSRHNSKTSAKSNSREVSRNSREKHCRGSDRNAAYDSDSRRHRAKRRRRRRRSDTYSDGGSSSSYSASSTSGEDHRAEDRRKRREDKRREANRKARASPVAAKSTTTSSTEQPRKLHSVQEALMAMSNRGKSTNIASDKSSRINDRYRAVSVSYYIK